MRCRLILVLIFGALPVAIPAQQPSTGVNPITQSFKGFGFYGNWLKAAFDSIPAARYDFKPTPIQQSVGYIAQHLEDANYQLCSIIGGTTRTTTAKDSLADTVKEKWPKDTLVARLWTSLLYCQAAFTRLDDARLAELVTVGPPGATRTFPRARYVMLFITDLAEHYAQIAAYMRAMGMVPPSALPPPKS
ncbi:MAG TPA: DinB family protein [Gemmatimonadaceae bacterium]|jgi:uncharacterized damage-inducible protein DinB